MDRQRLTQVGRALSQLGIDRIAAYSPQARGRGERNFQTWQGRLPQELRLRGLRTLEEANRFLKRRYIREFNRKFTVAAADLGTAFVSSGGMDLDRIFSIQQERVVNQDNTVSWENHRLQIEKTQWRASLAGCRVTVHQHLDGEVTIGYGPHTVGRYTAEGRPLRTFRKQQVA